MIVTPPNNFHPENPFIYSYTPLLAGPTLISKDFLLAKISIVRSPTRSPSFNTCSAPAFDESLPTSFVNPALSGKIFTTSPPPSRQATGWSCDPCNALNTTQAVRGLRLAARLALPHLHRSAGRTTPRLTSHLVAGRAQNSNGCLLLFGKSNSVVSGGASPMGRADNGRCQITSTEGRTLLKTVAAGQRTSPGLLAVIIIPRACVCMCANVHAYVPLCGSLCVCTLMRVRAFVGACGCLRARVCVSVGECCC